MKNREDLREAETKNSDLLTVLVPSPKNHNKNRKSSNLAPWGLQDPKLPPNQNNTLRHTQRHKTPVLDRTHKQPPLFLLSDRAPSTKLTKMENLTFHLKTTQIKTPKNPSSILSQIESKKEQAF